MSSPTSTTSPPPPTAVASATTESPASTSISTKQPPPPDQQHLPSAADFEPPLACVRRILKNTLPSSTNVGKDASAAFARAAGIFIIYLTACANDFAREHKRQTITANDVLAAVKELDFGEFAPEMLQFLETYRKSEKSKKDAKAAAAASKKGGDEEEGYDNSNSNNNNKQSAASDDEEEEDDEDHHPDLTAGKKRARVDASEEIDEPVEKRAKSIVTSIPDGGDQEF